MNHTLSPWYPHSTPTSTVSLISVASTFSDELMALITSAASRVMTETRRGELYKISRAVRGALASLTIIEAQELLQTAQDPFLRPPALTAIYNSTLNIENLKNGANLYRYEINVPASVIFIAFFAIILFYNLILALASHHTYFTVCFSCGSFLEMLGYIGRCVGHYRCSDVSMFLMQTVCLIMAPTFFLAGIYYLLGQFLVVHSVEYGILSPFTYSYIFVAFDIISLVIQAVGGAMAGEAAQNFEDTLTGTHIMLAGIVFQVASVTLFLFFWFHFLRQIYFKNNTIVFKWYDMIGFLLHDFDFAFHREEFEKKFDPNFAPIRNEFFYWFPVPVTLALLFIYARCIYRAVELSQGWRGNLMMHEAYLFVLDGTLVALCCLILVPFHPYFMFGNVSLSLLRWEKSRRQQKEHPKETPRTSQTTANDGQNSQDAKPMLQMTLALRSSTPEVEQASQASEGFNFLNLH